MAEVASDEALAALARTGATWVALSPLLFQATGSASSVEADPARTPSEAALTHAVERAHDLGLHVMVRPVIAVDDGSRRSAIVPLDAEGWFRTYGALLDAYLALAERTGVEAVCLGSSYTGLESHEGWHPLIQQARARYHGALTYGAALGGDYQHVPFWSELDYVGLDAVFGASTALPAWDEAFRGIETWQKALPRPMPVLFTSVGFSRDLPASDGEPDGQRAAFRVFFEQMQARPWVAGAFGFYWPNPASSLEDTGFALSDRPALADIRAVWGGPVRGDAGGRSAD